MQDTSPAARQPRDEPVPGRVADGETRAAVTWFEDWGDQPVDEPLIALIPLPDE
jgi:hypothetical protein